jgi:hypothetical protein
VHTSALDIFVLVSGTFSILATLPLIYLALRGYRDGRELRLVQREVATLMTEVRELQHEMHHDQRVAASEIVRTKETVERVAEATSRRRRLPRVRLVSPMSPEHTLHSRAVEKRRRSNGRV